MDTPTLILVIIGTANFVLGVFMAIAYNVETEKGFRKSTSAYLVAGIMYLTAIIFLLAET